MKRGEGRALAGKGYVDFNWRSGFRRGGCAAVEICSHSADPRRIFLRVNDPDRITLSSDIGHFEARLQRVFYAEAWRPDYLTPLHLPPGVRG